MAKRDRYQDDDWAEEVPRTWRKGPYRDYGWEAGTSSIPEMRDPTVHLTPEEWEEVMEWRRQNRRRSGRGPGSRPEPRRRGEMRGAPYGSKGPGYYPETGEDQYSPMGYYTEAFGRGFDNQGNFNVSWSQEELIPGPYTGYGPRNYQRSDDRILDEVCDRMTQNGMLDARNISVQVERGEVILQGTVDSRRSKRLAEDLADSVHGVQDVHNRLTIQRPENRRDEVDQSVGVFPMSGPLPGSNPEVEEMGDLGRAQERDEE